MSALLGAGLFANLAYLPALRDLGLPLKAVYSRSEASANAIAKAAKETLGLADVGVYHDGDPTSNIDALFARSDINAVFVVLPIVTQPEIIIKALEAGKHVLSEKPVGKDIATGVQLIKTYNAKYKPKGLVWRIAENFEAEPALIAAAAALRDGKIGKVTLFKLVAANALDESSQWYKTPWRTVPDYQGGFLLDGGVHSAALLRVVLPSPLTSISSHASLTKDYLKPHDTINSIVQTADGAHGLFELTFAAPAPSRAESYTTITGTKGWMRIDRGNVNDKDSYTVTMYRLRKKQGGKEDEVEEFVETIVEPVSGVEKEIESFFNAIAGKDDGLGDPRGALQDVAFIEAGLTSNGKPLFFADLVPQL